jgi:hypothetical protein
MHIAGLVLFVYHKFHSTKFIEYQRTLQARVSACAGRPSYHHVIYIATTSGRLDDDEPVDIYIAQEKSKGTLVVCISFSKNLSCPTYAVETETRSEMVCKSPRASDCIIPWSFMSSSSSCQPYKARRPSLERSLPLFLCRYL